MKKIGIYNPYLSTMGGGEKVCFALAEALTRHKNCDVYLITYTSVDLAEAERYFNLNLKGVKVHIVPMEGVLLKIVNRLPIPGAFKNLVNDLRVYHQIRKANYDIFINNCYQSNLPGPSKQHNVYMCMFPQRIHPNDEQSGLVYAAYRLTSLTLYRILLHPTKRHAVYTYDFITANSEFTQKYIQKYWGLKSEIIYPICEDMATETYEKKKMILTVGRFFGNNGVSHHKRHDFLIETFAKMKGLQRDGWELHIAGSVTEDVNTLRYILKLLHESEGLPIYLHFNAPFSDLHRLYNEATIYWHATGYGSDAESHPETQEHFGISTVEAMSTGAIPVVINSAGQQESVLEGRSGYLWSSREELIRQTEHIARMNAADMKQLRLDAVQAAQRFNKHSFEKLVDAVFKDVV